MTKVCFVTIRSLLFKVDAKCVAVITGIAIRIFYTTNKLVDKIRNVKSNAPRKDYDALFWGKCDTGQIWEKCYRGQIF